MGLKTTVLLFLLALILFPHCTFGQCSGKIMEPGFQFLSSSRGCAPFNVEIETIFLASVPGTNYYVNWGDNTPEEVFTQTNATGVTISHLYPNSPIDCGYDLVIDASNSCNPRGSVVPVRTQVVVWTNDVISVTPNVQRVCQGFATDVLFTDNSDWNCFPRATRENDEPRWIQWIYGTGSLANFIPGIQVNNTTPGIYPYRDPAPGRNPIYPVLTPGQISLPIHVPVTSPADIGKEFEITLKNWNQCNPYDNNLTDNNPFNPVNGNLATGDNPPQVTTGRVVIVESPQPDFVTRLNNATGAIKTIFCIGDNIYFDNNTPAIAGAQFYDTWEFFDNSTGSGTAVTSHDTKPTYRYNTSGQKLIRLHVHDNNAVGNCEAIREMVITVSPSLEAKIKVTDPAGNSITPDYCQETTAPFTTFQTRFADVSVGMITASTQWRWEFYDENNLLVRQEPAGGTFSSTQLGPFNQGYSNLGVYRVRLIIRDDMTACESSDEVQIRVLQKPKPDFSFNNVCEGMEATLTDQSTLTNGVGGQQIVQREWDLNYDGVTFNKDPSLDNKTTFNHAFGSSGSFRVALRVTTDLGGCFALADKTLIVHPMPVASFTPDVTSGCSVLTVNFTNTSITQNPSITIKEFSWEIDKGSGFETDSIQHVTDPGFSAIYTKMFVNTDSVDKTFDIRLRVVTFDGCEHVSTPARITVFPAPRSGFVSENYSPFNDNCSPVSVTFTVDDQTRAFKPSLYRWSISDINGPVDQLETGTTPKLIYNFINNTQSTKNFFVTLKALLPSGCYGDSTRMIRINPVPLSDFSVTSVVSDCGHMKFHIEATQKGLSKYEWTMAVAGAIIFSSSTQGDAFDYEFTRTVNNQNVTVSLKTTNLANCVSNVTTKTATVLPLGNMNVSFTVSPSVLTLPNATVTIVNTTNPGTWTYLWNFGDSTTSVSSTVSSHTYSKYGTYTIKLSVSDGGCLQTAVHTIQIKPTLPVLDFEYFPPSGCAPLLVTFNNLSQFADPATYVWDFGLNQGVSHAVNPVHVYYEPGVYSVTLSAANALGEIVHVTKSLIIEVYEKPQARFELKPHLIYIPGGKLYTKNESFAATNYQWNFGDGTTSTDFEPEYVYKSPGTFDVSLIASSVQGCSDTTTLTTAVQVVNGGELLVPNAFSPNTGGPGGTGQNDIFIPMMRGVSSFQMTVFNRWGQLLFETSNPEVGWDGYYNGRLCQQDVYVYKIVARYENGETITKVGDINLIR